MIAQGGLYRFCHHIGLLDVHFRRNIDHDVGVDPVTEPTGADIMHGTDTGDVKGCVFKGLEDIRLDAVDQSNLN